MVLLKDNYLYVSIQPGWKGFNCRPGDNYERHFNSFSMHPSSSLSIRIVLFPEDRFCLFVTQLLETVTFDLFVSIVLRSRRLICHKNCTIFVVSPPYRALWMILFDSDRLLKKPCHSSSLLKRLSRSNRRGKFGYGGQSRAESLIPTSDFRNAS